jgi:tetratricopeptide (TPR) repeat protein
MLVRLVVAGGIFALAVDHGTYGLTARHSLAIAVWWILLVAVGFDLLPRAARYRFALLPAAPLAAFALVTLASAGWADSAERVVLEFDRAALYLGVFLLVALTARRATLAAWTDGLAIGISATAFLALMSRCFPALDLASPIHGFLPGSEDRLSYPLDYWNGLAILTALAVPLLLRVASATPRSVAAAAALFPFPALGATIYLTSSRGGVATATIATIAFVALARRWPALAAAAAGWLGGWAGVAISTSQAELVNEPFSSAAREQGPTAAVLIVSVGAALGGAWFVASCFAPRRPIPRFAGWAFAGLLVVVAAGVAVAADPAERLESFKRPPSRTALPEGDFVRGHLLSSTGSGRWQFWETAIDQFRDAPLNGHGAGSFEAWWAANGNIAYFVRDAHSLYLEVLGELGLLGFLALAAFIAAAAAVVSRGVRANDSQRGAATAAAAAGLAFLCAAGIDWMWELTAVSVAGMACVALACAGTSEGVRTPVAATKQAVAARAAFLLAAWIVVCSQAAPLLTEAKVRDSQAAARRGDAEEALEHASAARNTMPWASSPHLQLALVREQAGALVGARADILNAIERDPSDWRLRIVAARIEARRGAIASARRQLAKARRLNPRSPIFRSRT